ncbi:MAG: hypothetical protein AB1806_21295 [Acidobacteriota bacterium]
MSARRRSTASKAAAAVRRREPATVPRMDFGRVAAAALAGWAASVVIGTYVTPLLLDEFYRQHAPLFRSGAEQYGAIGFGLAVVGFFVFAYAYAKGYEGGAGPAEGLRFGVIVGLLLASFTVAWAYVRLPISAGFAVALVIDAIVEMAIYGVIVGLVYRPLLPRGAGAR